jgi:hypothetical protein
MRRMLFGRVCGAAIGGLIAIGGAARAAAQPAPEGASGARFAVEGYLAHYSLDDRVAVGKQSLGAFGLRLTFIHPEPAATSRPMVDRLTGGFFATFSPNQGRPSVNTLHVGVETIMPFLARPAGGHLDPFASFGLGIFRTSSENQLTTTGAGRINRSDLAFTPALGTRIALFDGIGARADLRAPLLFGPAITANFVAEGGLYVSF